MSLSAKNSLMLEVHKAGFRREAHIYIFAHFISGILVRKYYMREKRKNILLTTGSDKFVTQLQYLTSLLIPRKIKSCVPVSLPVKNKFER